MVVETGGVEPRWLVATLALVLIPYLGLAYSVYRDARRRGSERATAWGVGMLLLGPANPLGVVFYAVARRDLEGSPAPATRLDRLVRNAVVASLLVFAVAAMVGPTDPLTQVYAAAVTLPILLGIAVLVTYRDALSAKR